MILEEDEIVPDMGEWVEKVKENSLRDINKVLLWEDLKKWLEQEIVSCDLPVDIDKYNVLRTVVEKIRDLEVV